MQPICCNVTYDFIWPFQSTFVSKCVLGLAYVKGVRTLRVAGKSFCTRFYTTESLVLLLLAGDYVLLLNCLR